MAHPNYLAQAVSKGAGGGGRSKYLAAALEAMQPTAAQPIRSGGELGLKLLAAAILGNSVKKEQQADQQRIAQAWDSVKPLMGGYQDGPPVQVATPPPPSAAPDVNIGPAEERMTGQTSEQAQAPQSQLQYTPPQKVDPAPINDPRWGQAVVALQQAGIDPSHILEWGKAAQPDIQFAPSGEAVNKHDAGAVGRVFANRQAVNNQIVDLNDPNNTNRAIPDAPVKGSLPIYDNLGNIIDWKLPAGAQGAIGQAAAAQSQGAAVGSSPYEFVTTQDRNGHPMTVAKSQAAGHAFVGQSPAEQAAATTEAQAGANGRVSAPSQLAGAQQSLDIIDRLLKDPELHHRVALEGRLGAFPGTHGVAIDAMHDQLKGKVFLQAYGELKGAGAITEIEGQKAESAIARLNRAQSLEDYTGALQELHGVVAGGMQRIQQRAGMGAPGISGGAGAGAAPPAAQRQAGKVYQTPRGPMKWTGTGWLPQ